MLRKMYCIVTYGGHQLLISYLMSQDTRMPEG
jgi:hypothetical protein